MVCICLIDIIHFLGGPYFAKLCYLALYLPNFFPIQLNYLSFNILFKIFILLKEIIIFIISLIVRVVSNY